jgi:hypothetical protein
LACPYSWPSQPTASARLLEGDPAFLPPEDIDSLRTGDRKNLGGESSELYAIGQTTLSAGILRDSGDLYNMQHMQFDRKEMDRRMHFWLTRTHYSENLRLLVARLCHYKAWKRWSRGDLWRWLGKHRARIGAHEFDGGEVELPPEFEEDLLELRGVSPR